MARQGNISLLRNMVSFWKNKKYVAEKNIFSLEKEIKLLNKPNVKRPCSFCSRVLPVSQLVVGEPAHLPACDRAAVMPIEWVCIDIDKCMEFHDSNLI